MGNICGTGEYIDTSYNFDLPSSKFTKAVYPDGGDYPKIKVNSIKNPIIRFEKLFPFHRMNIMNFRQIIYNFFNKGDEINQELIPESLTLDQIA